MKSEILSAIIFLSLIYSCILIVKVARYKRKKNNYKAAKKKYLVSQADIKFNNGLKKFVFDETEYSSQFICFALNEKNAKAKYKEFLFSILKKNS